MWSLHSKQRHENPLKQSALLQVMHTEPAVKGTAAKAEWLCNASKAQQSLSMIQAYNVLQYSSTDFHDGAQNVSKTVIFNSILMSSTSRGICC